MSAGAAIDRRARRTRELLGEALLTLGAEVRLEDLSVGDLTQRAGVSRSTFYKHFASRDDYLVRSWLEVLDTAEAHYARHRPDRADILPSTALFHHVAGAPDFVRQLVGSDLYLRQMAAGETRLRQIADANLRRRLPAWNRARRAETAIYVAAGFVGLLRWWMESGLRRSPDEMQAAFARLTEQALAAPWP